jgi:hypothetical protein
MSKRALKLIGLSLVCTVALALVALAQSGSGVEGTYNVTANSAELGTVKFVLILKRDSGKWTAEVKDSPTPLTITNVTIDDANKITITADAGGAAVTINGKFDKGEIAADWSAGDIKGTLKGVKKDAVTVAEKPAPASAAGASPAAGLEGAYDAKVMVDGQGELAFTLVIKRDGDKLVTEVLNGGDLNIVALEVKEGAAVTLTATFQGNTFQLPGKRTGSEMGGKWEAGGFSGAWSAKKK